jgi:hypothetical protein
MSEFDSIGQLVSQYAAEDFAAQRKRLREARMRWIEENECPTAYGVTTKDPITGEETTFNTPFQIGKLRYDQDKDGNPLEWHQGLKEPVIHEDPVAAAALLDGIDAIIKEAESPTKDRQFTVLVSGDEQHAFVTGGGADESPHPPILEGEDYGDYYARVSRAYERATGTTNGRPVAGDDGVRKPSTTDSPRIGRSDAPGETDDRDAGTGLDCNAVALPSGDSGPGEGHHDAGAGDDPVPGTASSAGDS